MSDHFEEMSEEYLPQVAEALTRTNTINKSSCCDSLLEWLRRTLCSIIGRCFVLFDGDELVAYLVIEEGEHEYYFHTTWLVDLKWEGKETLMRTFEDWVYARLDKEKIRWWVGC